jgi:hypothetical protein
MNAPLTLPGGLREGTDVPSPFTHVLAFGYYDGPTEGVLRVGPSGEVYRFVMTDELPPQGADETDLRTFTLSPLPPDTLDTLLGVLVRALAPTFEPGWALWVPVWRFDSPAIQQEVESRVDQLLAPAGPAAWEVTAENLLGTLRSVRRLAPGAGAPS